MLAISSGGRLGLALELAQSDRLEKKNAFLDQLLTALRRQELEVPAAKLSREEIVEGLEWYAGWWRDLLVLALGGDSSWLIHQDRLETLRLWQSEATPGASALRQTVKMPTLSVDALLHTLQAIYGVQDAVQKNANLRTAFATLLSRR